MRDHLARGLVGVRPCQDGVGGWLDGVRLLLWKALYPFKCVGSVSACVWVAAQSNRTGKTSHPPRTRTLVLPDLGEAIEARRDFSTWGRLTLLGLTGRAVAQKRGSRVW